MMLTGSVFFRDIGAGAWVLEADDGRTYQLAGGDRKMKKEGARIEVEGELDTSAVTAAMVGPVLTVKRYRFL